MRADLESIGDRQSPAAAVLKTVVFTVLVPGTVGGLLPYWIAGLDAFAATVTAAGRGLGVVLIGAGALLYGWCAFEFSVRGHGTPAPLDPPKRVATLGPYRFTRNPMYVAVLLVVTGQAAWHASPIVLVYAGALFCVFHGFVRFYEEPHLTKVFGAEYEQYHADVPRWILRVPGRTGTGA